GRKRWQIVLGNGQRFILPNQTQAGTLQVQAGQLLWEWPNGQVLTFNNHGYLKRLQWPNGNSVTIERHTHDAIYPHAIKKVINNKQQALHFSYTPRENASLLLTVTTPIGTFEYVLDASQRLIQVKHPHQTTKSYLYEAHWQSGHPYALTGLVLHTGTEVQRIRSWRYDSQGRAVFSVLGDPDAATGRLEIYYDHPPTLQNTGLTRIINHNGETTDITTRLTPKGYRITRVKGSGCLGCPTPGTLANYDAKGNLQQINNTLIKRNAQGNINELAVAHSGWETLTLRYDANGQEVAWFSQLTGWETIKRNANGQAIQRKFANGDKVTVTYDAQQRPIHIMENHGSQSIQTALGWHGYRLQKILHPYENEFRYYDQAGRLIKRH